MRQIILAKHKDGDSHNHPHFFLVNKGTNLGKPISFPQSGTYVCIVKKTDFEYLYWTCYYLWHSNGFKQVSESYLYTPKPLIELNQIIKSFHSNLNLKAGDWERVLPLIKKLERTERMFHLNNSLAGDCRKFS